VDHKRIDSYLEGNHNLTLFLFPFHQTIPTIKATVNCTLYCQLPSNQLHHLIHCMYTTQYLQQ